MTNDKRDELAEEYARPYGVNNCVNSGPDNPCKHDIICAYKKGYDAGVASRDAEVAKLVEALDKIKSGGGRAEIFGIDMYRCPQCASAEIATEALKLYRGKNE